MTFFSSGANFRDSFTLQEQIAVWTALIRHRRSTHLRSTRGRPKTVSYTSDAAGRLASLNTPATSYAPAASVSGISYAASGGLSSETYGNNLIHGVVYNNRLQANQIKLGTAALPTSVVNLTYNYGTTLNNGNVQSVSYAGGGLSYTQTFG